MGYPLRVLGCSGRAAHSLTPLASLLTIYTVWLESKWLLHKEPMQFSHPYSTKKQGYNKLLPTVWFWLANCFDKLYKLRIIFILATIAIPKRACVF